MPSHAAMHALQAAALRCSALTADLLHHGAAALSCSRAVRAAASAAAPTIDCGLRQEQAQQPQAEELLRSCPPGECSPACLLAQQPRPGGSHRAGSVSLSFGRQQDWPGLAQPSAARLGSSMGCPAPGQVSWPPEGSPWRRYSSSDGGTAGSSSSAGAVDGAGAAPPSAQPAAAVAAGEQPGAAAGGVSASGGSGGDPPAAAAATAVAASAAAPAGVAVAGVPLLEVLPSPKGPDRSKLMLRDFIQNSLYHPVRGVCGGGGVQGKGAGVVARGRDRLAPALAQGMGGSRGLGGLCGVWVDSAGCWVHGGWWEGVVGHGRESAMPCGTTQPRHGVREGNGGGTGAPGGDGGLAMPWGAPGWGSRFQPWSAPRLPLRLPALALTLPPAPSCCRFCPPTPPHPVHPPPSPGGLPPSLRVHNNNTAAAAAADQGLLQQPHPAGGHAAQPHQLLEDLLPRRVQHRHPQQVRGIWGICRRGRCRQWRGGEGAGAGLVVLDRQPAAYVNRADCQLLTAAACPNCRPVRTYGRAGTRSCRRHS